MKRLKSLNGPFEEQYFFETEEIDEMCLEALQKAGYLPSSPQPIKIERFLESHFQCLTGYDDFPTGILGCTQFNTDGSVKAVTVSTSFDDSEVSRRRERATWAHEGGHCLLHPSLFISSMKQGAFVLAGQGEESSIFKDNRILCRDSDIRPGEGKKRPYDKRWWEWQANRAIGGFLLPKELVTASVSSFLQQSVVTKNPSLPASARQKAEQEVAAAFDVNPIVARIRLQEMYPAKTGEQFEF